MHSQSSSFPQQQSLEASIHGLVCTSDYEIQQGTIQIREGKPITCGMCPIVCNTPQRKTSHQMAFFSDRANVLVDTEASLTLDILAAIM